MMMAFIRAEIAPESVNESFLKWLNTEVPIAPK